MKRIRSLIAAAILTAPLAINVANANITNAIYASEATWKGAPGTYEAGTETYTLTRDSADDTGIDLEVKAGDDVTLNLNGHTLMNYCTACSTINVKEGGNLTIKGEGTVTQRSETAGAATIYNAGYLEIDGGTYTQLATAIAPVIYNTGTLVIKGGTFNGVATTTEGFAPTIANIGGELTIETAEVTQSSHYYAVHTEGEGAETTIKDGTFTTTGINAVGTNTAEEGTNGATLTIEGGTFTAGEEGFALIANEYDTVEVSGGEFNGYVAGFGNLTISDEASYEVAEGYAAYHLNEDDTEALIDVETVLNLPDAITIMKGESYQLPENFATPMAYVDLDSITVLDAVNPSSDEVSEETPSLDLEASTIASYADGEITGLKAGAAVLAGMIKDGTPFYVPIAVIDITAEDDTEGEETTANEEVISETVTSIVSVLLENYMNGSYDGLEDEEEVTVETDLGTLSLTGASLDSLIEAISAGETLSAVLNAPEETTPTDEQLELIAAEVPEGGEVAGYFDISIALKAGNNTYGLITTLGDEVTVTMDVSSDTAVEDNYVRTYYIIRLHDDEAEVIASEYDGDAGTVTFTSDKFSIYTRVYVDTESTNPDDNGDDDNKGTTIINNDNSVTNNDNSTTTNNTTDNSTTDNSVTNNDNSASTNTTDNSTTNNTTDNSVINNITNNTYGDTITNNTTKKYYNDYSVINNYASTASAETTSSKEKKAKAPNTGVATSEETSSATVASPIAALSAVSLLSLAAFGLTRKLRA